MKPIITLLLLLCLGGLSAQSTNLGFQYQAVARAENGEILTNQEITMKVQILSNFRTKEIAFEEIHYVKSDQLGIINTTIGRGEVQEGSFDNIPWESQSIWINILLDFDNQGKYSKNNYAQLLAVPYAMYAREAGKIASESTIRGDIEVPSESRYWKLEGNQVVPETGDRIGSVNNVDILFITSDIERARINSKGEFGIQKNLVVGGQIDVNDLAYFHEAAQFDKDVQIDENLIGKGNAYFKSNVYIDVDAFIERNLKVNGDSKLIGNLEVTEGDVRFNNDLEIGGVVEINRKETDAKLLIDLDKTGTDDNIDNYPVQLTVKEQGIAIKTLESPDVDNNFIAFFDNENNALGRIEGETKTDILEDEDFCKESKFQAAAIASSIAALVSNIATKQGCILKIATLVKDIIVKLVELIGSAIASVVAGAGVADFIGNILKNIIDIGYTSVNTSLSVVSDFVDFTISAYDIDNSIDAFVNFQTIKFRDAGVTFSSGSADYAEWLLKENNTDSFNPGDVVGIKHGKITKNIINADQLMVISSDPIILGNMPPKEQLDQYEKVAFMGQVPVKVNGVVKSGDYLIASEKHQGFAIAVSPENISLEACKNIVGVSWGNSNLSGINYVKTAIGLNNNDVIPILENQVKEMENLKVEMNEVKKYIMENQAVLAELIPGYKERMGLEGLEIDENLITKSNEFIEEVAMTSIQNNLETNDLYNLIDSYTELRRGDSFRPQLDNAQIVSMVNRIDSEHNVDMSMFNTSMVGPFDNVENLANDLLNKDYIAEFKELITSGVSIAVQEVADKILLIKVDMLDKISTDGGLNSTEKAMLNEKLNKIFPIFALLENSNQLVTDAINSIFEIIDEAACAVCSEIDELPIQPEDIADAVSVPTNFFLEVVDFFVGTLDFMQGICIGDCLDVGLTEVCFEICPFGFLPDIGFEVDDLPFVNNNELNIQFPDMCATLNCN